MVTNEGVLQLTGPQSIIGSFRQTGAGVLNMGIAGNASGQYGALEISAAASLDGGLGLDLLSGFSLAVGDKFDVLSFSSLSGAFDALLLMARPARRGRGTSGAVMPRASRGIRPRPSAGRAFTNNMSASRPRRPYRNPARSGYWPWGFASLASWRWKIRAGAGSSGPLQAA